MAHNLFQNQGAHHRRIQHVQAPSCIALALDSLLAKAWQGGHGGGWERMGPMATPWGQGPSGEDHQMQRLSHEKQVTFIDLLVPFSKKIMGMCLHSMLADFSPHRWTTNFARRFSLCHLLIGAYPRACSLFQVQHTPFGLNGPRRPTLEMHRLGLLLWACDPLGRRPPYYLWPFSVPPPLLLLRLYISCHLPKYGSFPRLVLLAPSLCL